MVTLAAGTVLAMWIGELITERGIGNGISFIIFAGIVARVPQGVATFLANPDIAGGVAFVILAIVVVAVIVYIQEGQRRIPIQYASAAFAAGACTRVARPSCRCASTRPA